MSDILFSKKLSRGGIVIFNNKPNEDIFEVDQVHGNKVLVPSSDLKPADGLFVSKDQEPGLTRALAIKTADCLPITIIGQKGVAHLHAGWRGLHQEIFNAAPVQSLEPNYAFIGPAIQWDSYEVGAEFLEHFPSLNDCFRESEKPNKYYFNLPQAARTLMKRSYPDLIIEDCAIDTFTTPGHNSYRKNKTITRNFNVYYPEHLYRV